MNLIECRVHKKFSNHPFVDALPEIVEDELCFLFGGVGFYPRSLLVLFALLQESLELVLLFYFDS